ncbi:MAG TPA: ATP-dependent helicase, partial [Methylomirabilota bacterium]|nr:ATP-dependent helicase [Methylomirabilota bacterium]
FDRREVRDFLAYLKVMVNPHDDISLLRIANVPARGLSDGTMQRLLAASQERHCSVFSAMQHTDVQAGFSTRTRQCIQDFLALLNRTRSHLESADNLLLPQWAERFLADIGYIEELRRSEKTAEAAENRVRILKDLIATLDGDPGQWFPPLERLQNFLEEVTLDTEREEEKQTAGDAVTLITMHSCKGLEYPHVYVVGLEDGLLPHSRAKAENTLDEERRLFYVAITRAMRTLTLSYCLSRKKYGQAMPCHPSPFLKELPADLVEHANEKAKQPVSVSTGKNLFAAMRSALS